MAKNHARKNRARRQQQHTGAGYASANAGTTHTHSPLPDMTVLESLPYAEGRTVDVGLAARLVAACRAGCRSCQISLARKTRADRPTLAALAGAVCGLSLNAALQRSALVSPTTRSWAPLAQAAGSSGDGTAAVATVEQLTDADAADLLEDVLDHWAAGGVALDQEPSDAGRQGVPAKGQRDQVGGVFDIARAFQVVNLGDLELPEDPDGVPAYAVQLARTFTPDGQPLPMVTLECESAGAGIVDLRRRTNWQVWDARSLPELETSWRLRTDIATRSLTCLTRIDADGFDEEHVWDASELVELPEHYWDLLDTAQHVLVAGPVKDAADQDALRDAAQAGELLAVVARVRFL